MNTKAKGPTITALSKLSLPIPPAGTWTQRWEDQAYMGKGAPVQRHLDGTVGLAFRCWPQGGHTYARVAVLTGPMAGEVVDTLADDWIDADPLAVAEVQTHG
jgi:hypothetical protein